MDQNVDLGTSTRQMPARLAASAWVLPFLLVMIALLVRLWLVWQPLDRLITILADDAFLYFQIARNVAGGAGPAFDASGPTNGFHPLWLLLISPIWIVADGDLAVHLALTLAAVFGAASGVLVYLLGYRLGGRLVATVAAAVWAILPSAVLLSADGMETSLVVMCALLVLNSAGRYQDEMQTSRAVALGLAGGMMLLARTDTVFLFALVGLWIVAIAPGDRKLAHGLCVAGIAAVPLMPWLVWNLYTFGTIVQVSAVAVPTALKGTSVDKRGKIGLLDAVGPTLDLYGGLFSSIPFVLLLAKDLSCRWRQAILPLFIPLTALGALMIAHGAIRGSPRHYYFALLTVVLTLSAGLVLSRGVKAPRLRVLGVVLALGMFLLDNARVVAIRWNGDYPAQTAMLAAARSLNQLPEDGVVGAWNAGILGYYGGLPVINLDGIVSNAAYVAMVNSELGTYALSQNVTHIIDFTRYPDLVYRRRLRGITLHPVRRLDDGDKLQGHYMLYEVRKQ